MSEGSVSPTRDILISRRGQIKYGAKMGILLLEQSEYERACGGSISPNLRGT